MMKPEEIAQLLSGAVQVPSAVKGPDHNAVLLVQSWAGALAFLILAVVALIFAHIQEV